MEVDMFYKDRNDITHPRDEKDELNFEVIEAMRLDHLQKCLKKLLKGETIKVPNFSFLDGCIHGDGEELKLPKENGVLVMEGIFCLNPKLTSELPDESKFKVFMCPVSFFNLDNHHFLSEQIVRLVRRVSRDHRRRNKTANKVLFKWGQLQGGEDEKLSPFFVLVFLSLICCTFFVSSLFCVFVCGDSVLVVCCFAFCFVFW